MKPVKYEIPEEITSDKYYVALQRCKIFFTVTKDDKSDWVAHVQWSLIALSPDKKITFLWYE